MTNCKDYSQLRYEYNPKRRIVWEEVSCYIYSKYSVSNGKTIEFGCGYGDWLGSVPAQSKVAIESNRRLAGHARIEYGFDVREGDIFTVLPKIADNSFDTVLASNFFEHFQAEEVITLLKEVARILTRQGTLLVIQPNYRYCASRYFDDFTHRSVHSHISFCDLLASIGLSVRGCEPRFLPFSFRSWLPINRTLVRAYLRSPIRPFAAQFLICSQLEKK